VSTGNRISSSNRTYDLPFRAPISGLCHGGEDRGAVSPDREERFPQTAPEE
jgi:hypothetical protein